MLPNKWSDYYALAQEVYAKENVTKELDYGLYDLTMRVHDPERPSERDIIQVPENYSELVSEIAAWVDTAFHRPDKYSREGMALGLKDIFEVPRLGELAQVYASQLEKNLFNSYVHVDNIKIYRNFITNEAPRSSWVWHFDNNIKEQVKVLLYLTDVEDGCGQFELVWDPKKKEGIKIPTTRVDWEDWRNSSDVNFELTEYNTSWYGADRVPQSAIDSLVSNGNKIAKVLGKKGKFLLFDNCIAHRGTVAKRGHRDVVVLQFKPTVEKIEPALHRDHTGNGWAHTTFNVDPRILKPLERRPENGHEAQLAALRAESQ